MLDLLIRNGLVIDGTGNPGFYAAIGVENEQVRVLRGDLHGMEARRVIDAADRVVCPGLIDMHAHSGLVILGAEVTSTPPPPRSPTACTPPPAVPQLRTLDSRWSPLEPEAQQRAGPARARIHRPADAQHVRAHRR